MIGRLCYYHFLLISCCITNNNLMMIDFHVSSLITLVHSWKMYKCVNKEIIDRTKRYIQIKQIIELEWFNNNDVLLIMERAFEFERCFNPQNWIDSHTLISDQQCNNNNDRFFGDWKFVFNFNIKFIDANIQSVCNAHWPLSIIHCSKLVIWISTHAVHVCVCVCVWVYKIHTKIISSFYTIFLRRIFREYHGYLSTECLNIGTFTLNHQLSSWYFQYISNTNIMIKTFFHHHP